MKYKTEGGTIFSHTTDFSGDLCISKDEKAIIIPASDILEED